MPTSENPFYIAARRYAQLGWAVFPLRVKDKTPLFPNAHPEGDPLRHKCKGECGRVGHGVLDATKDLEVIEKWWRSNPNANIGLATGAVSGFWVLDVDKGHGGYETLDQLLADYAPLPRTPETLTGSGGNHILFKMPAWDLRNNAGTKLGKGLDIRGNGGYIVAPPSIHPNGTAYAWEPTSRPKDLPLSDAPGWLLELVKGKEKPAAPAQPVTVENTGIYVSKQTLDFFALGAEVGTQRDRAIRAARNYISAGHGFEETIEKVWHALSISPQAEGRAAWTREQVEYMVKNLSESTPPELPELDGWASKRARWNQGETEWIVCAAAYLVPHIAIVEAGWLTPAHFANYKTRHFWELFISSHDKDHAAHESGILPKLLELTPAIEPHLVGEYARQLTTAAYMTDISSKVARLNLSIANADIDTTRRLISEMNTDAPSLSGRALGTVESGMEKLDEVLDNPLNLIKTCIPPIDRGLRGLPLRFHSVWAARSGLGKTTLMWQIGRNVARSHRRVLMISLEMSETDLWGKAVCGVLGLDWFAVMAGEITAQQRAEFNRAKDKMTDELRDFVFIDDKPSTTDTVWQAVTEYKPELVIVDHLRLLKDAGDNPVQRLGKMTSRMKEIAKLGNCHVATIHQVNRSVESKDDKEPQMSDLRDSGLIEEDADMVCMLFRQSYYDKSEREIPRYLRTQLLIQKNRFGGGKTPPRINMDFDTQHDYYDMVQETKNQNGYHKEPAYATY